MKETTYFVRLDGGYFHKAKSRTVTFNIEGKSFLVKTSQVVFWESSKDQKSTEFLVGITEDQLKILKSLTKQDFDIRKRFGVGSLPPRPGIPPPGAQFLRWNI
jgi:hypothetical protein